MKKVFGKIKEFFKAIIKKLNNYRLTAIIVAGINLLVAIVGVALVFIYHLAGGDVPDKKTSTMPSFAGLDLVEGAEEGQYITGKLMGMSFFIIIVAVLILSIYTIYALLPYILNKEKVTPKKSPLILSVINGGLEIAVLVFSILAITLETPYTKTGYIITMPFTVITLIANFLCIVPLLRCVFYQPAIGSRLCPKKEAKAEEAEAK